MRNEGRGAGSGAGREAGQCRRWKSRPRRVGGGTQMSGWGTSGPRGHSAHTETALGSNIKQEKVVVKLLARRSLGSQRTRARAGGAHPPARPPSVAPWAPTPVALRVRKLSCRFLSSLCLFEESGSSAGPFDNKALAKNSATVPEMLILLLVNSYSVPRRRAMRVPRILAA